MRAILLWLLQFTCIRFCLFMAHNIQLCHRERTSKTHPVPEDRRSLQAAASPTIQLSSHWKQKVMLDVSQPTGRFRFAIRKGPPFLKPLFMVVAWNSSWYCHNQTTDPNPNPNPNRIPNHKLPLLEIAEMADPSEWRPFGIAGRHRQDRWVVNL